MATANVKKKRQLSERAKRVKKELIDQGMTQRELAAKVNVNENYLIDMLAGRKPGKKYWDEIEWVLGINQR